MALSLHLATFQDAGFLYDLFVTSRERELAPLPPQIRETFARQQYELYQQGLIAEFADADHFIVRNGNGLPAGNHEKAVGMVILAERPDALWVVDMAVEPSFRNGGVGTAVLLLLMARCRKSEKPMRGSVTPYNPARQLYRRLGVKELPGERGYISLEWRPD